VRKHFLIIAGETSGDKHGAKLISEFKKESGIEISSIGGHRMEALSDNFEENIVDIAAVGFFEVIKFIPFFIKLKNRIVKKYFLPNSEKKIDAIILIDYPGFNLRLAKIAKKFNIPVFYYIAPQVWAWGSKRVKLLVDLCDKIFCVFKFEEELFKKAGGKVEFVGHPILEDVPDNIDNEDFCNKLDISNDEKVIGLLPGSRINEVKKHLPVIKKAVEGIAGRKIVAKSPSIDKDVYMKIWSNVELSENVYAILKRSNAAIISSGTSTLEASCTGTPFITVYQVSPISYVIAKSLVKVPYISMVNILAEKEVSPELIQKDFNPGKLKKALSIILEADAEKIKKEMERVRIILGPKGASKKVAQSIMREMK